MRAEPAMDHAVKPTEREVAKTYKNKREEPLPGADAHNSLQDVAGVQRTNLRQELPRKPEGGQTGKPLRESRPA